MTTASHDLRQRVRQAVAEQPYATVTVLSSLLAVQDAVGYLPPEAMDEVAERTGASVNDAWGVASFYPNFRFTPPGRHRVEVCWGPTCHLMGAQPLLRGVMERLELSTEGETQDGAITLKLNTCLGCCAHAPAMSFDHHLRGPISLDDALGEVDRLRAGDGQGGPA